MSAILRPHKIGAGNASDQEEQSKDEIISQALQKLLDRKIDNTIATAEASLSTEVVAPIKKEEIRVNNVAPIMVSPTTNPINSISPIQESEVVVRPGLGQEIKISKPAGVTAVSASSEVVIPIKNQQPIPLVQSTVAKPQSFNQQPSSQIVEIKPVTPITQVVTNQTVTPPPLPTQKPTGTIAKFFDSLFGSAPKTPPQSV